MCLGCVTDKEDPLWEVCQKNVECKTCVGANCNSKRSFSKCKHCNTENDPQCAINPDSVKTKDCNAYVDDCYTFIGEYNIMRGCLNEQNDDILQQMCSKKNSNKCAVCSPDGDSCNIHPFIKETCVDCDSKVNKTCIDDPKQHMGKICNLIDSTDKRGCYLRVVRFRTKS